MAFNVESCLEKDTEKITEFLSNISGTMYDYINEHSGSQYIMFYKYLTHSDLPTFGKSTKSNSLDKNFLYYLSKKEMEDIESQTEKPFQTAHQSSIGLKRAFYTSIGVPDPREEIYLLNDYMDVLVVNDNLKYFKSEYTKKIFDKLEKPYNGSTVIKSWNFDKLDIALDEDSAFTPLELHVAVHGLGERKDEDFHKLRHHIFKGDTFILLCELNENYKRLFIILEKNPIFFSILGETNDDYEEYKIKTKDRLTTQITNKYSEVAEAEIDYEVNLKMQLVWRNMLAKEMMGYTPVNRQVFCPITYITLDYDELGTLLVATHIKGINDEKTTAEEKYDINNGLLLSTTASALFDKHLITIDENKDLLFSIYLDDYKLKNQLLLLQPIFRPILNEKRMQYLAYHKSIYDAEEFKRSNNTNLY